MTGILRTQLTQGLNWFRYRIQRLSVFQPLVRRLRTGKIKTGVGADLWFFAGDSTPEYRLGCNEMPVQETIGHYTKPGDVFYDIGANVGFFTVIAARIVGEAGHVYSFEPVPENIQVFEYNIQANGFRNVTLFKQAVSNVSGNGQLQLARYSGGASLASAVPPPDYTGAMPVKLVAVDDLIAEKRAVPPTFVKIDVEGAELEVLQGMEQTLRLYRPSILFEIDDSREERFQKKAEACSSYLQSFGYHVESLANSYPNSGWLVGHFFALFPRYNQLDWPNPVGVEKQWLG